MTFLWPTLLWSLLAIPLLAYAYLRLARRRDAQRAALGTMGETSSARRPVGRRRHVPVVLFLVALAVLCVALARPVATVHLPHREGKVILAFDVSASMTADDIAPNRLRAAKRAALRFVDRQPDSIDIGVVAFSTAAFEVVPPTENRIEVREAIRRLTPTGATAVGRGIVASINTIAGEPVVITDIDVGGWAGGAGSPSGTVDEAPPADEVRVPFLGSSAVVLLTDGEDTTRTDPVAAAELAGRAGVRIFPVGIGSAAGAVIEVDGYSVATYLNEQQLQEIAAAANGEYFRATDADALSDVYNSIDLKLTLKGERIEITALLAGVAIVILLVAAALSARWLGRIP